MKKEDRDEQIDDEGVKDRGEPSTPSNSTMGLTDGRIEKKDGAENEGGRGVSSIKDAKRNE